MLVNLASYPRVYIDGATPYGARWGGGNVATGLTSSSSSGVASTLSPNSDYLSPLKSKINQFNSSTAAKGSGNYFASGFSGHQVIGTRNHKMPVCSGVQSFVMATRAPVFHACTVDLSWQTTVHACQRCPRAAMTLSAATAAIATQSNVEGTNSRFCPAGVHMGKCLPAQDIYTDAWGTTSISAMGGGIISRMSQKFADSSKSLDVSMPPPSLIEPWVPPDLPLPTTVHSKASFSPTVPVAVQSPLPDESAPTPSSGASIKPHNVTPVKPSEDKEIGVISKESNEIKVSADKSPEKVIDVDKSTISQPKSPRMENVVKPEQQPEYKDTKEVSY